VVQNPASDRKEANARNAESDPGEVEKQDAPTHTPSRKMAGGGGAGILQLLRGARKRVSAMQFPKRNLPGLAAHVATAQPTPQSVMGAA